MTRRGTETGLFSGFFPPSPLPGEGIALTIRTAAKRAAGTQKSQLGAEADRDRTTIITVNGPQQYYRRWLTKWICVGIERPLKRQHPTAEQITYDRRLQLIPITTTNFIKNISR